MSVIKRMGYAAEVEMNSEVEGVEMKQFAQPVFPILPVDGNLHLGLCLVASACSLPVCSYHKSDHSRRSGTPLPSDLFAHTHNRPLYAGLSIVVSHGCGLTRGSAHYTSHLPGRALA